ncbi:hypothetical protein ACN47E_002977 [Coniothyrium glycines]
MATMAPPRRFKVEPLETTIKSSKDNKARIEHLERPRPIRRFAPEPIETTTKNNRKAEPHSVNRTARRFAPQHIETTSKTNRQFAPEPVETTTRRSRQRFAKEWDEQISPTERRESSKGGSGLKRPPKKFTPQLIETAQRTRRAGAAGPTLLPSDKTEATPDSAMSIRRARILGVPTAPANSPTVDLSQNPLFLEIQRNACPMSRRRSYFSSSQHSFRVPDLDPIESSESEASAPPSPTSSSFVTPDHSYMYKEATRMRESVDARSAGYLLQLAAKAAEKQLREQAMAAFPNDDHHEPVDHYVDRDVDGSGSYVEEARGERGPSFTEVNWELKAMQSYQDKHKPKEDKSAPNVPSTQKDGQEKTTYNPFGSPAGLPDEATAKKLADEKADPELERMRKGARPPMLGNDIRFPRCSSPEPCRFDPTQGCDAVRTAMCYLSEQTKAASEKGESLWCGQGNGRQTSTTPSLWSTANSRASSSHGLWGGMCVNGGDKSPRGPSGLLTPYHERANPLSPCPTPAMSLFPPSPPASAYGATFGGPDFSNIDDKLALERNITEEFGDDFVTQVYNYLSLGYPSMAHPFDVELSKISNIPVDELRQDDHLAQSRGYIRLGKDGNLTNSELTEETCMRWRALRVYIQEWARQHPGMAEDDLGLSTQGAAVRKGSWGL